MADDNVEEFLEDESLSEKEFHLQNPDVVIRGTTLRHSATTDTLDSVYLEPTAVEEDVQDIITAIPDLVKESTDSDSATGILEETIGTVIDVGKKVIDQIPDVGKKVIDQIPGLVKDLKNTNEAQGQMNISSYFADQNSLDDPFNSSAFVNVSSEDAIQTKEEKILEDNVFDNFVEEESNVHQHLESRLSHEEPESVDFQVESDVNVMEASLQLIDDKEDFEMFTAENDPDPEFTEYGVSPGSSLLSERIHQMHLSESDQNESEQSGFVGSIDRQLSSASHHSVGSEPIISPLPVSQFSSNQFSPFATPTHQPVPLPPVPASQLPSQPTPTHQKVHSPLANIPPSQPLSQPAAETNPSFETATPVIPTEIPLKTPPHTTAFSDTTGEDLFLSSIQMSDSDRQHDAWLPGDHSNFTPVAENLSTPGLVVNEPQGDPVRDLVYRYMGEQEAIKRQVLTIDSVTQNIEGLQKLIAGGCYRSAVDLTGRLLTETGQGPDQVGQITTHTTHSLQLWFCRFALLMKLRYYSIAESEFQAFQNLDTPDLYYEYYPRMYPGRKGSMVPFGMRILHAELPHYLGRSHEALDRLYYVLAVAQKILINLEDGLAEDGSAVEITSESRKVSKELWQEREKQVLYIIGNTFLAIKDYEAAVSVYDSTLSKDCSCKADLLSGIGRIYLQIGNVPKAKDCFKQAEVLSDSQDKYVKCRNFINRGLEGMCLNNFSEAFQNFKSAVECDPKNSSAVNNMAVCSLYVGKLMEALKSLEVLVHEDPERNLHEGVLFNLCTLYELESSRALHKKQALLDLVSRHKGDGFPVACLKMA
ncbi:trafficking protein particle complex subunit 12-like isoform X2 [Mytilus trossulus]|uniref:trafficking protein particle complex subunit 12-like isoform X1 n=1 Tax=Mytilus trossulus TaxID=6551 RepID=UPI003005BA8D